MYLSILLHGRIKLRFAVALCNRDDLDMQLDPALFIQLMMTVSTGAEMILEDVMFGALPFIII